MKKDKQIMLMEIRRDAKGLTLKIKSKELESYLLANNSTVIDGDLGGIVKFHNIRTLSSDWYTNHNYVSSGVLMNSGRPNMAFIMAEGIGAGVEFKIAGPFGRQVVEDFARLFKDNVIGFYKRYIKPVIIKVDLSISDIY